MIFGCVRCVKRRKELRVVKIIPVPHSSGAIYRGEQWSGLVPCLGLFGPVRDDVSVASCSDGPRVLRWLDVG